MVLPSPSTGRQRSMPSIASPTKPTASASSDPFAPTPEPGRKQTNRPRPFTLATTPGPCFPSTPRRPTPAAIRKLDDLARELTARDPGSGTPVVTLLLEDAISEAKRTLGPASLVDAVRAHIAHAGAVQRVKLTDAVAE